MKLLCDYFFRYPREYLHQPGRCRVRIYKRKNGTHTVLLTELNNNSGESVSSACARIATHLAATKALNPKTTRWIQHEPAEGDLDHEAPPLPVFDELEFTWDSQDTAHSPQWTALDTAQVEALTGATLLALEQELGDLFTSTEEKAGYATTKA